VIRGSSLGDLLGEASFEREERGEKPVVLFSTPWLVPDAGWTIAARLYARAMRDAGVDVRLMSFDERITGTTREVLDEVRGCVEKPTNRWDLQILSAPIGSPMRTAAVLANLGFDGARAALHCVFESLRVEPEVAGLLDSVNIWAQCTANRDALLTAGVSDVELIGMPWFENDPLLLVPKPDRCDRFLWVGREEFRKAPENLVRSFLEAFPKNEATLTLKVSAHRNPKPYASIEEIVAVELERVKRVMSPFKIVRGTLSGSQMLELYASHDVYCSASRGEGWDLPAYHMKLAGRRVVSTDSGGPRDFVGDGDTLVPQTGEVDGYADHDLDHLITALQLARSKPGPGSRPPQSLRSDEVGRKFKIWVERLTA
jgi:glycosyltransferase involved in cell wall biosynthesis